MKGRFRGFKICATPDCDNQCEGNTDHCASCNHAIRKGNRQAGKVKKVVRINPISEKRKKDMKTYAVLRAEKLAENPVCQMRLEGCTWTATEVHHSEKRGVNYLKKESFISACRSCHTQVEEKLSAAEARKLGFRK